MLPNVRLFHSDEREKMGLFLPSQKQKTKHKKPAVTIQESCCLDVGFQSKIDPTSMVVSQIKRAYICFS